jgi:putative hydrolase of the HAD superfamily
MKTYRAVLFDLFDTVVDFHLDRMPTIEFDGQRLHSTSGNVYQVLQRSYSGVSFDTFYAAFRESRRQVDVTRNEEMREYPAQVRFERMLELLNLDGAGSDFIEELVWAHMSEWAKGAEMPKVNRRVLELAKRKAKIGIVSNFDHPPTAHLVLEREGIRSLFDVIVISGESGWRKPHRGIFLQALDRLGCTPKEALFVGDTFGADVVGSKSIGMDSVWLNRKAEPVPESVIEPDFVLAKLEELEGILTQIP